MARVALLLLLAAVCSAQSEFKDAGVCARCHVVSVLEWSISGHTKANITCQGCHGPSAGHVENERNEVKPDRRPVGAPAIATFCQTCHGGGCPSTKRKDDCQSCHHVHALVNPTKTPQQSGGIEDDGFLARMDEGEAHVRSRNWRAARDAFEAAARIRPNEPLAKRRLAYAERRLNPSLPGFEAVGTAADEETALPLEVRVAGLGIPMRLVRGGACDIGSDTYPGAGPAHTVRIEPFYLGTYEITQAEWAAVMGTGASQNGKLPAGSVSWQDAQAFVANVNERIPSGGFRLPSEAEWECAARAGAAAPATLARAAWFKDNTLAPRPDAPFQPVESYGPRPVGGLAANAWGFFDMLGNVWEWTSSRLAPYPYDARDGRESAEGDVPRVLRGGGFADAAETVHPSHRHSERPSRRLRWNGMRLARTAP